MKRWIVVERLRAKYPEVRTRVVISGEPSWPNAKVFSLAKMIASSDNDYLVISDSDVLVGPDFLAQRDAAAAESECRTGDLSVSRHSGERTSGRNWRRWECRWRCRRA